MEVTSKKTLQHHHSSSQLFSNLYQRGSMCFSNCKTLLNQTGGKKQGSVLLHVSKDCVTRESSNINVDGGKTKCDEFTDL